MNHGDPPAKEKTPGAGSGQIGSFFAGLLRSILQDLIVMAIVFGVATGISAAVCFYYGLPLALSLIGGFLAIGAVFVVKSNSILG